jgi:hypothetical protein
MAREENAAAFGGSDRRKQIGFAGEDAAPRRRNTEVTEICGNPIDEVEVGAR